MVAGRSSRDCAIDLRDKRDGKGVIDTVALSLVFPDFSVTDPSRFGSKRCYPEGGWSRTQNSTRRERLANVRRPSLTWSSGRPGRPFEHLRIELSLPKLLFGDNLSELQDSDAGALLRLLSSVLCEMGVMATPEALWRARLSVLHVGKNVPLPKGMTCSAVNRELASYPQRASWQLSQKTFENGGDLFKLHRKSFEFVSYDKLHDIGRARKAAHRATHSAADDLTPGVGETTASESAVLRVECRFNTPQEIRKALARSGHDTKAARLCDVFRSDIAMGVLLTELERFELPGPAEASRSLDPLEALTALLARGVKAKSALAGEYLQILEQVYGSCAVRGAMKAGGVSDAAWYRLRPLRRGGPTGATGSTAIRILRDAFISYAALRPTPALEPPRAAGELPVALSTDFEGSDNFPSQQQPAEALLQPQRSDLEGVSRAPPPLHYLTERRAMPLEPTQDNRKGRSK
jgi:hypothetical protein